MSELPVNWSQTQIAAINRYISGTLNPALFPDETFELYSVPAFPSREPELLEGRKIGSAKQLVEPGDILICKINPRINRVWQVNPDMGYRQIASSEWVVVRAFGLNAKYLQYYFSSDDFRELICQGVTGVGGSLTRAQPKRVATFPVPVAPLNEQNRIADKLEALLARVDACRTHLDNVPRLLKRFRQAVLAAATSGELTADWRKDTEAEKWALVKFSSILNELRNGVSPKPKPEPPGIPILRISSVRAGKVDLDDIRFLSDAELFVDRYQLNEGDLLFTRYNGSEEFVGVCGMVRELPKSVILYPDKLIRARLDATLANPRFIEIYFSAPETRNRILDVTKTSAGQIGISGESLKGIEIDLPSLDEQHVIVHRIEALFVYADRLEARYTAARSQVEKLTSALLEKAFRGELVPQDPNDEPAAMLLERIRTAQAGEGNKPRKTRKPATARVKRPPLEETMLKRSDVSGTHLSDILRTRGQLTPEALWSASNLEIYEFYEQLKDEETRELLRELRRMDDEMVRLLEAIA